MVLDRSTPHTSAGPSRLRAAPHLAGELGAEVEKTESPAAWLEFTYCNDRSKMAG
jgi:hypothetical protein